MGSCQSLNDSIGLIIDSIRFSHRSCALLSRSACGVGGGAERGGDGGGGKKKKRGGGKKKKGRRKD